MAPGRPGIVFLIAHNEAFTLSFLLEYLVLYP